jgi:outer membrane biosynthesis protein TonB
VLPVPPPPKPPSPRRRTLAARTDRNLVLTMYAEGWRQKVELHAAVDALVAARSKAHVDPVVTVALRSDGSVESVVFDRSSGVPEIDEAIRLIVQTLSPYDAFPPDLANDYDVVEIRRVWTLETALRLLAAGR